MKIDKIIYKTLSLLAGGLLAVSMSGCLSDSSDCIEDQPGYQEGNDVWLSFDIRNMGERSRITRSTRAADLEGHPDEEGEAAENYIDCTEGFELLLFDDQDRLIKVFDRDELLLQPLDDAGSSVDGYESAHYKLTAKINKAYFDYSKEENVEFYLLLVVNMNFTNEGKAKNDSFIPYEYVVSSSKVSQTMRGFNYYGYLYYDESWTPQVPGMIPNNPKRLIPMSGKRKMSIPRSVLEANNTSYGEPFELENDIDMLRAMAKIRIIDLLESEFEPNAQITGVDIIGYNTKGSYIPLITADVNSSWGMETTQIVEIPTTNNGNWFKADSIMAMNKGSFDYDGAPRSVFISYLPEYAMTDGILKLQFHYQLEDDGVKKYTQILEWNTSVVKDIARNHIYEITVTRPDRLKLELNLEVKDWVSNEEHLDFNDHPSTSGEVTWATGSYNSKDGEKIIVFDDKAANVYFTIETPKDCRWTAYLIPIKGNGAFTFTDKDGNPSGTYPTGFIDGTTRQDLYIKPTNMNGVDEEVSAELCVMVTTQDGQEVEVNLVNGTNGRFLLRQIPK